ncbi:MAG: hypothetical protein OSB69_23910, partial [Alphaproteobacteria bacterium]|nr:hypothetical protein [Alphaproteobacteria bacterium]
QDLVRNNLDTKRCGKTLQVLRQLVLRRHQAAARNRYSCSPQQRFGINFIEAVTASLQRIYW